MTDERRIVHEKVVDTPTGQMITTVEDSTVVVPTDAERRWGGLLRLRQIVYFVASLIAIIILIRFVLLAMGANMDAGFGSFMLALSDPFVAPFNGLFGAPASNGSVFEISDLVAIAIYFLLAWGIVKIAALIMAPRGTNV